MKKRLNGILTLLLVFVVQLTFAQQMSITGTVTDENGLPLPGVNVIVKGTNKGTQTDFDGNYSLEASKGETLAFSYVGYKLAEILVANNPRINAILAEDAAQLEEVIIVGYGTATKQSFAGTATTISAENLEVKSVSNISQALAGEVAGVNVINTSGQPGTSSTIRIRGFGSVNGNRDPLYVVDGVPFSGSLNSINPSDIKTTTILKDASATAIYGSRGANGVVLITTKTGGGDSFIEVDVRTGVNDQIIPRYDVIRSPETYTELVYEGIFNRGVINGVADPIAYANARLFSANYIPVGYNLFNVDTAAELIDPATGMIREGVTRRYTPESYIDEAFDSAIRTEANVRFGGGNEKTTYFASVGYLNDDGYAINTGYDRYTTRLNVNSQVKEWLKVGANIGYAYSESLNNGQTVGSENVFEFADKTAPIFGVFLRDENGQLVPDPIFGGNQIDYGSASTGPGSPNPLLPARARPQSDNLNPIGSALYDFDGTERNELNGNFSLDIDITEKLVFETRFGAQYFINRRTDASNPFYGTAVGEGGNLFKQDTESLTTNFLQLLRYNDQFGDHTLEVLAAHESNDFELNYNDAFKTKAVASGIYELNNYVVAASPATGFNEGRSLESYFAQVNYDFLDRYYLTGSVRRDGSSRFVNDKWGTFGSVGAAWVVSNEDFLYNNDVVSFLKFKASYGILGDEAGVGFYSGYDTFNINNLNDGISLSARGNGNPDLTWETSNMFQVGTEFSLGKWLDASVDYYVKNTEDQIFQRRVGPSQGIATITVNDGDLRNAGLEFNVTGYVFKTSDFNLNLNVNGEILSNEITKMPLDPSTGEQRILDPSNSPFAYSVGRSIFDIYVREYAGVDPSNGAPLWYQYFNDVNSNGILDGDDVSITSLTPYLAENPDANIERTVTNTYAQATDKYIDKSAIPDVRGGFRIGGNYKSFNFSSQFVYSLGGYAIDFQYAELMSDRFGAVGNNFHTDILNRWQNPGDITDVPALTDNAFTNGTSLSDRFLTSTDYLALNNVLLGYTINKEVLSRSGIDYVNIFVSGDNLFAKTAREGFLPNTSETGNSGRRLYAPLTTFTAGLRVKF